MSYAGQLKSSFGYHWRIFRECWDILTLGRARWYLVLIFLGFFALPLYVELYNSFTVSLFLRLPRIVPPPSVGADILSARDFVMKGTPLFVLILNYYWVKSDGYLILRWVIIAVILVGFLGAELRGKIDKEIYDSPR